MKNILEKIITDKKSSLEFIKKEKTLDALEKSIKDAYPELKGEDGGEDKIEFEILIEDKTYLKINKENI